MRKTVLILFLLFSLGAAAQVKGDFTLSIGSVPYAFAFSDNWDIYGTTMGYDLYSDYELRHINDFTTSTFNVGYERFLGESVKVGAMASYFYSENELYDPVQAETVSKSHRHSFALLAQGKYCYKSTKRGDYYSGVGAGVGYTIGADGVPVRLAYEVIPFGFCFGRHFPVMYELVFGNTTFGFRFGFCYRF